MKKILAFLSIALIGWYGWKLFLFNDIILYIHEKYILFFLFGSTVCLILGGIGFCLYFKIAFDAHWDETSKKPSKRTSYKSHIQSLCTVLPLLFFLFCGFLLQPRALSSIAMQDQKNMDKQLFSSKVNAQSAVHTLPAKTIDYSFNDWMQALIEQPIVASHSGKKVRLEGFLFKHDEAPQNVYYLYRYIMYHCTADAMPYGFRVKVRNQETFKQDEWVKVEGTFTVTQDLQSNGSDMLQIEASSIEKKPQPKNPYLYPLRYY